MNFLKWLFGKNKSVPQDNQAIETDVNLEMSVGDKKVSESVKIKTTYDFLERFAINQDNPDSCDHEPNENEIKVRIADISPKHMIYLNKSVQRYINRMSLKGFNNVALSKDEWDCACKKVEDSIAYENGLLTATSCNLGGIELEKSGDIQGAIALYEENIAMHSTAIHSYERLMIIYHRLKDYENEKRVIETAIQVFDSYNKANAQRKIEEYPEGKSDILAALDSCTILRGENGWVVFNPVNVNKWRKRLEKLIAKM